MVFRLHGMVVEKDLVSLGCETTVSAVIIGYSSKGLLS